MANKTRVNPAEKAKARKSTAPGEEDMPEGPMILHGAERAPGSGLNVPGWMKSIGRTLSNMGKRTGPGRPVTPHPAPPKAMTQAEADSIYNKYVK